MQIREASINNKQVKEMWLEGKRVYPQGSPIPYDKLLCYYNAKGRTNQDADREILPDLTGNGYDLKLNDFTFSKMSGYGGFRESFTEYAWKYIDAENIDDLSFHISKARSASSFVNVYKNIQDGETTTINIVATGTIPDGVELYFGLNGISSGSTKIELDTEITVSITNNLGRQEACGFKLIYSGSQPYVDITITQIPEYPGSLVTDGIDDNLKSVIPLPALVDDNYTIIPVFDHISVKSNGIIVKKGTTIYFLDAVYDYRWYNFNQGTGRVLQRPGFIGITNNIAYYENGTTVINANPILLNDIENYLYVGGTDGSTWGFFSNIALYGLAVFNGVNLSYEQIKEVYDKIIDGTLINELP